MDDSIASSSQIVSYKVDPTSNKLTGVVRGFKRAMSNFSRVESQQLLISQQMIEETQESMENNPPYEGLKKPVKLGDHFFFMKGDQK
jgi:hypothetical protein